MRPVRVLSGADHFDAELLSAVAAALASGTHRDHDLLILYRRLCEVKRTGAKEGIGSAEGVPPADPKDACHPRALRLLVCTPAHTPLGIAAKLAIVCAMSGVFEAAQEAPDGPVLPHVILSAFLDAMTQARLLPSERPSLWQ